MSDQYDEHEQSERVKKWLINNGSNLLTGLLLAVAAVSGWHWWQGREGRQAQEAVNQYQTFVAAVEKPDAAKAVALGNGLIANYADSDFAFLAALRLAKLQQQQGKPKEALAAIDQAATLARDDAARELAQVRKAQLQLAQGDTAGAAKTAAGIAGTAFPASLAELKGDLATAAGKREEAAAHYRAALTALDADAASRGLIEMKLTDAGGSAEQSQEIR